MIYRFKTSAKCQHTLADLQSRTGIKPNILCRYAISLSLLEDAPINVNKVKDSTGLEFNRQVLTGKYDTVFKAMISHRENRHLTDEEYFPLYIKAHIERGAELLKNNYDLSGNKEKFLINLARVQNGGQI